MKRTLQTAIALVVVLGLVWLALRTPAPSITVTEVVAHPIDGAPHAAMITLTISNDGGPDMLIDAQSPFAELTTLKSRTGQGLPVPANGAISLVMEGGHIVLMGLESPPKQGTQLPIELTFLRAGEHQVRAHVGPKMSPTTIYSWMPGDVPAPEATLYATPSRPGWAIRRSDSPGSSLSGIPRIEEGGYANLYIDGAKVHDAFVDEVTIGALLPGRYEAMMMFFDKDHRLLVQDAAPISATVEIVVD
ncbi:MAG: copper chaperone PCu(A)C [Pseudomonadota bacterium]